MCYIILGQRVKSGHVTWVKTGSKGKCFSNLSRIWRSPPHVFLDLIMKTENKPVKICLIGFIQVKHIHGIFGEYLYSTKVFVNELKQHQFEAEGPNFGSTWIPLIYALCNHVMICSCSFVSVLLHISMHQYKLLHKMLSGCSGHWDWDCLHQLVGINPWWKYFRKVFAISWTIHFPENGKFFS